MRTKRQVSAEPDHVGEVVVPDPGDLIESLRDFGYTLPTALADLLDNSLTATAKTITVLLDAGRDAHIAVIDDGRGMDEKTLVEAMRLGTQGPLATRQTGDLGRFGLGLKTASLSQGRCLTVISKAARGRTIVRRLDIPFIQRSRTWSLLTNPTTVADAYVARVAAMPSGTAVVIEDLDRAGFQNQHHHSRVLESVAAHLSMVFHRFIAEDRVRIVVGSTTLKPWDPFLRKKSTASPIETLILNGHEIVVSPFVLPHHSLLSDDDHDFAAGPNGWNMHQGFYLYRCKRLIVPGSWLNLRFRQEEHYKLARIQVDIPNSLDADWHLNVMKSHAAAPPELRDDFLRIANDTRKRAVDVYRYRGEGKAPIDPPTERFVWKREATARAVRYRIDRTHPVVQALLRGGCEHETLLSELLELVERTIPIATILQEPVKSIDAVPSEIDDKTIEKLFELVIHAERFLVSVGRPPYEARDTVLAAEPFARYRAALLRRLQQPH